MTLLHETRANLSSCWEDAQGAGGSIVNINKYQYLQLLTLFENVLPWENAQGDVGSIININKDQYLQLPALFENFLSWENQGGGVGGEKKSYSL